LLLEASANICSVWNYSTQDSNSPKRESCWISFIYRLLHFVWRKENSSKVLQNKPSQDPFCFWSRKNWFIVLKRLHVSLESFPKKEIKMQLQRMNQHWLAEDNKTVFSPNCTYASHDPIKALLVIKKMHTYVTKIYA
jgi:hypothetical protein